jgi:hypothetical protein
MIRLGAIVLAIALVPSAVGSAAQTGERPVRTFPQFAGSWILDEGSSSSPLLMVPRVARILTIATSPSAVTVTREELILSPSDTVPPVSAEVYRFDGKPAVREQGSLMWSYTFLLVADALALSRKDEAINRPGPFTMVTDAYSVDGDVLTVHRQLTSVTEQGEILVMQEPRNNTRHTFLYRRRR